MITVSQKVSFIDPSLSMVRLIALEVGQIFHCNHGIFMSEETVIGKVLTNLNLDIQYSDKVMSGEAEYVDSVFMRDDVVSFVKEAIADAVDNFEIIASNEGNMVKYRSVTPRVHTHH